MNENKNLIFFIMFLLFTIQSFGGYFQILDYKKSIERCKLKGNLGIGQKKGKFFSGYIVIITCDDNGYISYGEILNGITFTSRFKSFNNLLNKPLIGNNIYELLKDFNSMNDKEQKKYIGYINCLKILESKLNNLNI